MTGWPDDRHLSDEELSDLVDGVPSSDAEDHVGRCLSCSSRLDGWRSVSSRLAGLRSGPAAPAAAAAAEAAAAERREEAVAAALAVRGGPARERRPPGRYLRAASGVAAAAAVIVALVVGVTHLGGGSAKTASHSSASDAAPAAAGAGAATGNPAARTPATHNLGELSGPADLVAGVDRLLPAAGSSPRQDYASAGAAASSNGPASTSSSPGGQGASAAPAASQGEMIPQSGAPAGCPDTARLFPATSPRLLLSAGARYRSTPAQVYVYQVGAQRRAVVVDARSCAVLANVAV